MTGHLSPRDPRLYGTGGGYAATSMPRRKLTHRLRMRAVTALAKNLKNTVGTLAVARTS